MSNIPQWYDRDACVYRDDIWPFQKHTRRDARLLGKDRLAYQVKRAISQLPNGWSLKWKSSRRRTFRINHTLKTISVPFPANATGMANLSSALHVANAIAQANLDSARTGIVRASYVRAWSVGSLNGHFYPYATRQLWRFGGYLNPHHPAWKKAHMNTCHEVLRYLSSPHAWVIPRVIGGRAYPARKDVAGRQMLYSIAYWKYLKDYIQVNSAYYPLPAKAIAKAKKFDLNFQP